MRKNSKSRLTHFSTLDIFVPIPFEFKVTARHLRETDEQTVGYSCTSQSSLRLPTKLYAANSLVRGWLHNGHKAFSHLNNCVVIESLIQ